MSAPLRLMPSVRPTRGKTNGSKQSVEPLPEIVAYGERFGPPRGYQRCGRSVAVSHARLLGDGPVTQDSAGRDRAGAMKVGWASRSVNCVAVILGLVCALSWSATAQSPAHRDRIADGLVAAAIMLPAGVPSQIAPGDLEVVDDGRIAQATAVASGQPPGLAILVDVANGESAKVGRLLDLVDDTLARTPVEATPIRHLNQFSYRAPDWYKRGFEFNMPVPRNRTVHGGGKWQPQWRPLWNAADWALASLHFRRSSRVLVVVTDGIRRPSQALPYEPEHGSTRQVSFGDFRNRVRQEFATVVIVAVDGGQLTEEHREIALESGGDAISLDAGEDVRAVLVGLAQQIAEQRVIYFKPANPNGRVHRLEVRLKAGAVPLQAPTLYLAPRPQR